MANTHRCHVMLNGRGKLMPNPGSTYSTNGQLLGRGISDGDTHSRKTPRDVKTYTEIEMIRGWGITQSRARKRICFYPTQDQQVISVTLP